MAKLQKKQRNAEAEMYNTPKMRGWITHKEYINYLRAIGEKTWQKHRHYKKEAQRTECQEISWSDKYYC